MTLEFATFGWWDLAGVLAGGLAYYALGALWYMALFGERWVAATGRTAEEFEGKGPGAEMLVTLVGCVVTTGVLALVYRWAGGETVVDGLVVGAILGVGVAATEGLKAAVYNVDERVRPWARYAIDGSYAACGVTLAGAVYGLVA